MAAGATRSGRCTAAPAGGNARAGTRRTKHITTNVLIDVDEDAGTASARSYWVLLTSQVAQHADHDLPRRLVPRPLRPGRRARGASSSAATSSTCRAATSAAIARLAVSGSTQLDPEEPHRVAAHDLVHEVVVEAGEQPLGDFLAVRPRAVGVRVVGLERHLVGADRVDRREPGGVVEEAAVDASPVVGARRLGDEVPRVAPPAVVLPHAIGAREDVGDPADLALGVRELHVRVAHEQAREQPVGQRALGELVGERRRHRRRRVRATSTASSSPSRCACR